MPKRRRQGTKKKKLNASMHRFTPITNNHHHNPTTQPSNPLPAPRSALPSHTQTRPP
ncbi:hypothetical protein BDY21DRAFT_331089 [Lineolata rhizophorae]|uniref:Uncharacterized protein n=1 Tax=Lineolata rhizophorae TaxID=578093 RepID=A0A6A6PG28_9PEZI|nr:hypothetical protein BDY21DRAFT_331089 [Lineolata rhizophorae]